MKHVLGLGIMVAVMSIPGFALNRDSAKINVATPFRVGSRDLPAGDYKVTWTRATSEVQVSFSQGKKVIVTVPAKLTQADNEAITDHTVNGVEVDTAQEGSATVLQELQLPHLNLLF